MTFNINSLDALNFDNRFMGELSTDPDNTNTCRQVMGA